MFSKELTKIGLSGAVGLVLGLLCALNEGVWTYVWLVPLQTIGIVYSYQYLLRAVKGIFQWCSNVLSLAIGTMNCMGTLIGLVLMVFLMTCVLQIMWIVGLGLMVYSLFRAFQQDGMILQLPLFPVHGSGRKRLPRTEDDDDLGGWDDDDDRGPAPVQDSWDDDGDWDND